MNKLVYILAAVVIAVSGCGDNGKSKSVNETAVQSEIRADEIYFFYSNSCPHCHEALEYINGKYPDLKCAQKFKLGKRIGTPLFCMGDNYLMGWAPEYEAKFDSYVRPFAGTGK